MSHLERDRAAVSPALLAALERAEAAGRELFMHAHVPDRKTLLEARQFFNEEATRMRRALESDDGWYRGVAEQWERRVAMADALIAVDQARQREQQP